MELLVKVFEGAVDHNADATLQLAAVCKHWSAIVHDAPSLWTRLHLSHSSRLEEKADVWLRRSKGRILDMDATSNDGCRLLNVLREGGCLTSLLALRVSVRHARLLNQHGLLQPYPSDLSQIVWSFSGLPNLVAFHFDGGGQFDGGKIYFDAGHLPTIARLRHLTLKAEHVRFFFLPTMPSLCSLYVDARIFNLNPLSSLNGTLAHVLQSCGKLQSLYLKDYDIASAVSMSTIRDIPLPRLESLELHGRLYTNCQCPPADCAHQPWSIWCWIQYSLLWSSCGNSLATVVVRSSASCVC